MKKLLLATVLAMAAMTLGAQAQSDQGRKGTGFFDVGLGYYNFSPDEGKARDLGGVFLSGGWYVSNKSRLSLDIGVYLSEGDKVGWFHYTSGGTTKTDGVIKLGHTIVPITVSWNFEFKISKKAYFRVGPSVGGTVISSSFSFDPSNVKNKPKLKGETSTTFSYGGSAGFAWDVARRSNIYVGYRFLGNTEGEMKTSDGIYKTKSTSHQVMATYGWRF